MSVLLSCVLASSAADARTASAKPSPVQGVGDAIARSVAGRIGGGAHVTVTALQTRVSSTLPLVAVPEPGARTGSPARFVLLAGRERVGTAVATVHVQARHVRARRPLDRHHVLSAADVEEITAPVTDQPIRRLPALAEVIGARVRRRVAAGEVIAASVIDLPPHVKSGDRVNAVIRIGSVEVAGQAVASGSGRTGDLIRVLVPGSRRPRKARIAGPGKVEIIQ